MTLTPVASLSRHLAEGELVALDVGPDGLVYAALALRPLDDRVEQPGWASFPKTVPGEPQTYRVLALDGDRVALDVLIGDEPFNIHHVQPLGDGLLLACARAHYNGGRPERNARVYTRGGEFGRGFTLGDGIQSVQATRGGVIWTSYFDEGVFGNFGWDEPAGAPGLAAWGAGGERLYAFEPPEGLESICDCYALNVASEEDVWFYYYTQFPLVRLRGREVAAFWQMPVSGSDAFAVEGDLALFRGGYDDREGCHLFRLGAAGRVERVAEIRLRDVNGDAISADRACGRGAALYLLSGAALYRLGVGEAAGAAV